MAAITPVEITRSDNTVVVQWQAMEAGDVGLPWLGLPIDTLLLRSLEYPDKTIQASGTFTEDVTIEGTLEGDRDGALDGAAWETMTANDLAGTPMVFAAAGVLVMRENPVHFRPVVTAGSGGSVTVTATMSR